MTDTMLKSANVKLLLNRTICSGKYLILVGGDVAPVTATVESGQSAPGGTRIDSCLIPSVGTSLFPAISGSVVIESHAELGVLESFSVAAVTVKTNGSCNNRNRLRQSIVSEPLHSCYYDPDASITDHPRI